MMESMTGKYHRKGINGKGINGKGILRKCLDEKSETVKAVMGR
jgi:hypothetical protein